jgi:hypothetical protein
MAFLDDLRARNPELFKDEPIEAAPAGMPPGAQQIVNGVNSFMPVIERVTGLNRREIFLQLMKSGVKGGNLLDVLTGLAGNKPAPEAKFVKYVKTLAIWVPVALGLTGFVVISLYILLKAASIMLGGL